MFSKPFFYPQLAFTFVAMSRTLLVLMCFAVLLQSFQKTWIVTSWKINQSYIAAELCEKRFEEKSCCLGSCYLNKELKENEEQEQSAPVSSSKSKSELVCDVFTHAILLTVHRAFFSTGYSTCWKQGQPIPSDSSIFHPPSFLG